MKVYNRFSCGKLEFFIIEFFLCWAGRGGKLLFNVKKWGALLFKVTTIWEFFFIFHLLTVTGVIQKRYGEVLGTLWKSSRCLESEKKCICSLLKVIQVKIWPGNFRFFCLTRDRYHLVNRQNHSLCLAFVWSFYIAKMLLTCKRWCLLNL